MFSSIFFFEVKSLLKTSSTYIYFGILSLVSFFIGLMIGGAFDGMQLDLAGEKIMANSPVVIDAFYSFIGGWIGAIIVVAIVGNSVLKDFKYNFHNLVFSTPITKFDYLFGRYAGSVLVTLLVMTGPAIGIMLAYASPWVDAAKFSTFSILPYLNTYWQTIIPNVILEGALFFAVSVLARDIFIIWVSLIIFWVAIGASNSFIGSLQYETISALLDPFGGNAKRLTSKYWSIYDKNNQLYAMSGLFLMNRLLWLLISALTFIVGYIGFSFSAQAGRLSFKKPASGITNPKTAPITAHRIVLPKVHQEYTTRVHLSNLIGLSIDECKQLLRNTYFRIIALFGLLLLFLTSSQAGKIFDTATFPVTGELVEYFSGTFKLFIVLLTIIFSGETLWRAREQKMDNIIDALPVPSWVFYISKLIGIIFMQVILLGIIIVASVIVQAFKGYYNFEFGLYFTYLYGFGLIDLVLLAIVSMFIQTLSKNKFVGYFITALFYIWTTTIASLVVKHNLLIYSSDPGVVHSDMNGFSAVSYPFFVYKLYWSGLAIILAALTSWLWNRGTVQGLKWRITQAGVKARGNYLKVIALGSIIFLGCGSFIYYNNNVLNKYRTSFQSEEIMAQYEKKYKKFQNRPQPKIGAVKINVDIFPHNHSLQAKGVYTLYNKTQSSIDSIHLVFNGNVKIGKVEFIGVPSALAMNDEDYDYRIYKLQKPLNPGDSVSMSFSVELAENGFAHNFGGLSLPLDNGTFLNNENFLPNIGYNPAAELSDNDDRKKHGLGYRKTSNSIDDSTQYATNLFTPDADFISFDAVVSTIPDQIAIAPGYLQKEWTANGRRYFHYKMDSKIMNFYSFLSAKYEVKKDKWNDVNIEIYYHKGHEYNLDRMIKGIKASLAYYNNVYTPYQHKQARIIEFPKYATFAQSFPNTIPFSEGIGFIANVDTTDEEAIDYPYYVTAHEMAHQWFAHQLIGANVEGSNMMSEALAEYSAISVLEKKYSENRMNKFLHIDLDKYLSARSRESEIEKPLGRVDIGQQYVFYQKGSIIMHGLGKYIGEDSLNIALKRMIEKYAFKGAPYPTTKDLVREIRKVTPDSLQYLVTDGFEKIVLYENEIKSVKEKNIAGKKNIEITIDVKKYEADTNGKEIMVSCNDYFEVGLYKNSKDRITLNKYKLKSGINNINIPSDEKIYKAVIDPRFLLIDKKPNNNTLRLDGASYGDGKKADAVKVKSSN